MTSPVLWYAARATGLVSLVLLTATVVLGLLTTMRVSSPRWPRFATQDLHRRVSLTTLVFLGVHILATVIDTYVHVGWAAVVVPFASPYKTVWVGAGAVAVDALAAVAVSSLARKRLRARTWRSLHWLAYLSWPAAVVHGVGIGTDMRLGWVQLLTAACVGAVGVAGVARVLRTRLRRPVSGATRPVTAPGATGDRRVLTGSGVR
jgi:DMSO/TMAO reductase YedYZ heme-binding membrane subunit